MGRPCTLVIDGRAAVPGTARGLLRALNDPVAGPAPLRRAGAVASVADLSDAFVEVVVGLTRRLDHAPGQGLAVAFDGFPPIDLVPTLRVDGSGEVNDLVFHLRRRGEACVSAAIGRGIQVGHLVRVRGPLGPSCDVAGAGRLVLAASAGGFPAIWAIARAARYRHPEADLALVVGAAAADDLYMRPALDWLAQTGAGPLVLCAGRGGHGRVRRGAPADHLPLLRATDRVIAAGAPAIVAAVAERARAAGAACSEMSLGPGNVRVASRPAFLSAASV